MRQNDLLKSDNGDHLRVLLYGDQQSYVVNCQRCKMPFPISTPSLLQMEKMPQDMYRLLALDEDISDRQRQQRDRRAELIAPLLAEECICDKSYRNRVLREIVSGNSVSRKTVLQYLWLYWVYQSKNALLPAEKSNTEKRPLSSDEKTIRWALNKFYYTPQKQSLQTAYKMMLHAKYCDAKGKLKPDYPSFWQFRYYFRQHRDPISESISREGIKAYQRNHRPFIGAVSDYAGTIGTYMTDATVADIYIVSRLSRRPIGRPVIYTMVDAYSRLITGVYVGLEGGQYALRLLLQNTFADKVSFCRQHNIEIDPQDWPSHHLPTKIMTDRGSEFLGGPLENLCESYGIEIENLPAYRPDLKGIVEKLFDLIQCAYKPLLKGKGVVESDIQERGAPDYRRQGALDLEQFSAVVLRCVLYYNSQYIQSGFFRTPCMASAGIMPTAAAIWSFCAAQDDCPVSVASDPKLLYALLPRADGKITQRGLELFNLRFSNYTFKKRFVAAGLNGREIVKVAYSPDCLDTVYLYENGDYIPFSLTQKMYLGKSLAEIADMQQNEKSESANWKRQELQAQIDLMNDIMQIADSAERGISDKGKISPQIQRGRTIARAQEHMSMQVETIAIKSGNIIVDAILTQKIDECLDNGIVLDMKVEIPSHIMREEDTCEVFGSILDFAVAVSNKQPTDKKIKIVLQDQDNKLKVFVTANAAVFDSVDATRMTEIEQSTTKILSAYNGIVSAQHDEDQSTITWNLLIPLPQDNEWLASYIYDSSEALSSGVRTVKQ